MTTIHSLHFKWTVSRGRDTYGYNICTLIVDGNKVASCNGGGYDMQGTCLGNWLQNAFQVELLNLFATKKGKQYGDYTNSKGQKVARHDFDGLYGAIEHNTWIDEKKAKTAIILDGACGFDSMRRIAEAIGIQLKWNKESDKYKNHSFYTAIIEDKAVLA